MRSLGNFATEEDNRDSKIRVYGFCLLAINIRSADERDLEYGY